jgi:hypothetical protein
MSQQQDTINTDPNEREQALIEYIKIQDHIEVLDPESDFEVPPGSLVMYEIAFEVSITGKLGGDSLFHHLIENFEPNSRCLAFGFSGYAGDPRPLFELPNIKEFIRAFLFGLDETKPDMKRARRAIGMMFPEYLIARNVTDQDMLNQVYDLAGALWVTAHAFPEMVFLNDRTSPTGYSRNIGHNELYLNALMQNDPVVQQGLEELFATLMAATK